MKWIKNNWIKIILVIMIIIIIKFYLISYYNQEKKEYLLYNDYTRADMVMTLTYNKNFQFYATRKVQSLNSDIKLTAGDLIYDFAQYEFLPILNYLNSPSENEKLKNSFTTFLTFLSDYYYATIGYSENILVRQSNGKYYTLKNGVYIYNTKMNVIGKKGLNSVYNEYLISNGHKNIEQNFLENLYSVNTIKKEYTYNEMKDMISNNYNEFYSRNEKEIIEVISSDLKRFNKYLYTHYIFIDADNNDAVILLKEINTEPLELTFKFKTYDRIYSSISKYYTHTYTLDINDVWEQLKEKGYPKIYS